MSTATLTISAVERLRMGAPIGAPDRGGSVPYAT